jgi:hypothetical protein
MLGIGPNITARCPYLMITNNMREKCAFEVAEAIRSAHPKCGFVFLAGCQTYGRESFRAEDIFFMSLKYHSDSQS